MDKLDKIIYYQICDFMYQEYCLLKKESKDKLNTPFDVFCNDMSSRFLNNVDFSKKQKKLLYKTSIRSTNFFGITELEFVNYFTIFLSEKIWQRIHKSVQVMHDFFK